jgi:hypothetical protein
VRGAYALISDDHKKQMADLGTDVFRDVKSGRVVAQDVIIRTLQEEYMFAMHQPGVPQVVSPDTLLCINPRDGHAGKLDAPTYAGNVCSPRQTYCYRHSPRSRAHGR